MCLNAFYRIQQCLYESGQPFMLSGLHTHCLFGTTYGACATSQQSIDERPMTKATYLSGVSTHSPNTLSTHSAWSLAAPGHFPVLFVELPDPEPTSSIPSHSIASRKTLLYVRAYVRARVRVYFRCDISCDSFN